MCVYKQLFLLFIDYYSFGLGGGGVGGVGLLEADS